MAARLKLNLKPELIRAVMTRSRRTLGKPHVAGRERHPINVINNVEAQRFLADAQVRT